MRYINLFAPFGLAWIPILPVLMILLIPSVSGQNISSDVYPSDEEIYEAYLRGDIDYHTYQRLTEIYESGIDSASMYLLEEIPNVNYFSDIYKKDLSGLEKEQTEPFEIKSEKRTRQYSGLFGFRRFQYLEEDDKGKDQYYLDMTFPSHWRFQGRMKGDYTGHRVWASRAMKYANEHGTLKRVAIGNFTTRFGLGLTVGYRGSLLSKGYDESEDSYLYPYFGGFNGLYVEGGRKSDAIKVMVHNDQNSTHRFRAAALDLMKRFGHFRFEGIYLSSQIINRFNDTKYSLHQWGSFLQYKNEALSASVEVAFPDNTKETIPAAIMETRYDIEQVDLRLSAWKYSADYLNFAGGGRSGLHYNEIIIDTAEFEFSDRRNNQKGFLVKGFSKLENKANYEISFSQYGADKYQRSSRVATAMETPIAGFAFLKVDYKYSEDLEKGQILSVHKARLEFLYRPNNIYWRSYIGYNIDKENHDYCSVFTRFSAKMRSFGKTEFWLNFDKINSKAGRIDYWYGYIRESIKPSKNLELGIKYSYRYNREYDDKTATTFLLDAELSW
jgi:hypothetical protein